MVPPGGSVIIWGWEPDGDDYYRLKVDTQGRLITVAAIDELDDIGDVDVASPTTLYILYWNGTNSKWECRAFGDWHTAALHELGGAAEPDVTGLSGLLADGQTPLAHKTSHQNGGADEVSVAGLSGLLADDQHVLDSEVITAVGISSITFIIDGGGSAITTGEKGHLEIPFACTINRVTMMADQSGSIVVDIWKDTYANFPPTDADSITASAPPTISSAQKSQDDTLTGWTTAISADDILAFNVDSCTTITRVTISLQVTRT